MLKRLVKCCVLLSMFVVQTVWAEARLILKWDTQAADLPSAVWVLNKQFTLDVSVLTPSPTRKIKTLSVTTVQEDKLHEIILLLRKTAGVLRVEQDQVVSAQIAPNDERYTEQNHHEITGSESIWDEQTDCSNVKIAVLDTGVDLDHADLVSNIWINEGEIAGNGIDDDENGYVDDINGYNFIDEANTPQGNNIPEDDAGHGTHVAGIIGAVGNNTIGISGVCWQARIIPIRVLKSSPINNDDDIRAIEGSITSLISGLVYATTVQADIIVMSLTFANFNQTLLDELINAQEQNDALIIVAAGNSGLNLDQTSTSIYPASYTASLTNLITVANAENTQILAERSNFGANTVDIAAPGVSILSTWLENSFEQESGTSMAAPIVAGAAALLKSNNPSLNAVDVRSALIQSTIDVESFNGQVKSGGYLNLATLLSRPSENLPSLFNFDVENNAVLKGHNLSNVNTVTFNQYTLAGSIAENVDFTPIDTQTLELASVARKPGFYAVDDDSANTLVSLQADIPPTPSNVTASPVGNGYEVSWGSSELADEYLIERNLGSGWNEIETVESPTTLFIDNSELSGVGDIEYRVSARYQYLDPATDREIIIASEPSSVGTLSHWLTEELATLPARYDFVNIRLQTSLSTVPTFSVTGNNLPASLYLSEDIGHIVGDPVETGDFNFSIAYNGTTSRQFSLTVTNTAKVLLDEPNADISMRFELSRGQFTSLQNKSNLDIEEKSIRFTAYNFDNNLDRVTITADPNELSGGIIDYIQAKTTAGEWQRLDNNDDNVALNNGLSWTLSDASVFDLNTKEALIEAEFAVTWQQEPTLNSSDNSTETSTQNDSGGSSGGALYYLILVMLVTLKVRKNQ